MAGSITNPYAELKILGTHAPELSLSMPLALENTECVDEALEVIHGNPDVIVCADETSHRYTSASSEVSTPRRGRGLHFANHHLELVFTMSEHHASSR